MQQTALGGMNVVPAVSQSKMSQRTTVGSPHASRSARDLRSRRKGFSAGQIEALELIRIQRDLGIALSRTSNIRAALRRVLAETLTVKGIDGGGVYLVNRAEETVELVAHRGLSREFVRAVSRYDIAAPMARKVMRGLPVYRNFKQVQENPLFVREGLLSVAAFPIRYSRDVIAVVNLASRTCRAIPRYTRTVLAAIAAQIGTVVPRIRAESERREARTNLKCLFDTTDDMLFIADQSGSILEVNETVLRRLGYSRKQILGRPLTDVHPRPMRDEVIACVADLLAGRETQCHVPLRTRSGAEIPVETHVTTGTWDGNRVLFGISRDVRERKRLEQEVVRLSESEKGRIARDIHDNQMQQLVGIRMMASTLKSCLSAEPSGASEIAGRIHTVAVDMIAASRRTVQGLAPIAPIRGGMEMALHRLAQNAKETYGCDCVAHCRLGKVPLDPEVATQLYYIAQESVRNAWSHGAATRIDVRLTLRPGLSTLSVTDNGSGLKKDAGAPTGMGLRIMAHRAAMIGGRLTVAARSAGGTVVRCEFRRSRRKLPADGAARRRFARA